MRSSSTDGHDGAVRAVLQKGVAVNALRHPSKAGSAVDDLRTTVKAKFQFRPRCSIAP